VEIHFVSSLTIDDENHLAPALLQAVAALLQASPLAYTIRIETAGGEVFEHQHAPGTDVDSVISQPAPHRLPAATRATVMPFRY
jgi:hypothetical protein